MVEVVEDDDWIWEKYAEDEYCLWCCTKYLKNEECPDCNCDEILDELVEGDPRDLEEECIDELDCPLDDWDGP